MDETPDIASIAVLIGDPTRAKLLMALIGGRALTATELAGVTGVTKQTISAHLSRLLAAHLIVVQSADGSLVVGDSHHYGDAHDPFQPAAVDDRILSELAEILGFPPPPVIERWTGTYPSGPDTAFAETPLPGVRLVMVTSGTGASTAFAIAEETIADLLDRPQPPHTEA